MFWTVFAGTSLKTLSASRSVTQYCGNGDEHSDKTKKRQLKIFTKNKNIHLNTFKNIIFHSFKWQIIFKEDKAYTSAINANERQVCQKI